ncbi:MAG: hypothetical protein ABIT71_03790 [Vicinamibacteraceae bacterium]
MDAGADLEPRRRHDQGVDERALDAVVDRRLVAFVEDADRHQQHAGPDVEAPGEQEVDVRLFQLEFAALLEPLDESVLELQLTDEPDARRKLVRHEQDEAMEVEPAVGPLRLVVVEVHVAGQPRRRLMVVVGGLLALGLRGRGGERRSQGNPGGTRPRKEYFLTNQNSNSETPKPCRVK